MRLHSCRICGTLFVKFYKNLLHHICRKHKLSLKEYVQKCGLVEKMLEETLEEKKVNLLVMNLHCPFCYKVQKGFQHFHLHMSKVHGKKNIHNILRMVSRQLGLVVCKSCMLPVVRDFLHLHDAFQHGGKNPEPIHEEKEQELGSTLQKAPVLTVVDKEGVLSAKCMGECQGYDPALDGCLYLCPMCEGGAPFHSLAAVTTHVKRCHGGDMSCLEFVKDTREEKMTSCKLCGQSVVHDRIELGCHVWTEHGLPLELY